MEGMNTASDHALPTLVTLRPVDEADLALLCRELSDPVAAGEFQWFGFRAGKAKELERRWRDDALMGSDESWLVVSLDNVSYAGSVNWRPQGSFGNYEIGIVLLPEYRGRGIGTEAQRLLVAYLFDHSLVHRLQAGTEVDNLAEQRSLEKVGFRREGIMRGAHFRAGLWRDSVMYGLLRGDPPVRA
jgi:RimJ/RimL family protein N-acetyltransferase